MYLHAARGAVSPACGSCNRLTIIDRSAFNTKLGFETRELLSKLTGDPLGISFPGYQVRQAVKADISACNALCHRVHGHHRDGEFDDAVDQGSARVVEHLSEITANATDIALSGHAVAETNQGLNALIGAASGFSRGGFLLPTRMGSCSAGVCNTDCAS